MTQFPRLSNREWEVVKLLLQGKSNKLIAASLDISVRTVEFHLTNIYAKFQVSSRIELILKLGSTTGEFKSEKPGRSTVVGKGETAENRDKPNLWMIWAIPFKETVSIIGKELKMKNIANLKLAFSWISVTTVSSIIGLAISVNIASYREFFDLRFLLLGFAISGLLGGFGQWIILRAQIKRPLLWLWIPATAAGIPLGLFAGYWVAALLVPLYSNYLFYWTFFSIIAIVAGVLTGTLQWFALNRKPPSIIWLLLSAISFLGISIFCPSPDNQIWNIFEPASKIIAGAIYGGLLGIFLGVVSGINIIQNKQY